MSISQSYSSNPTRTLVPSLLAALICSGCLFTEAAPSGQDNNKGNNTTVVVFDEDMGSSGSDMEDMGENPADLGDDADLGDSEDLGTPPEDMGEEPMCNRDEDCEGDFVCVDGACVPFTCEQDADCGPMGVCSVDGMCSNLVDDPENCGVKGFVCPSNTFCGGGMCVCDGINPRNNSKVIASSTNDGLVHYPKPQMMGYFPFERFLCNGMPLQGAGGLDCSNEQISFDPDYPAEAPHYLLGFVADRTEIELRLIDERGDLVQGSSKELRGIANRGEKEVRSFRILQNYGPLTLMFVWWHDEQAPEGKNDFVHLYTIEIKDNQFIDVEPVMLDNMRPFRGIETSGLADFSVATNDRQVQGGKALEVLALPYVYDDQEKSGDDLYLDINTFATLKELNKPDLTTLVTTDEPIHLGTPRQLLNGFNAQVTFQGDALFISTTTLEHIEGNAGFNNALTAQQHRVFRARPNAETGVNETAEMIESRPWELYRHLATNALDVFLNIAFGNDISDFPPAPFVFAGGGPAEWIAMGWSRSTDLSGGTRRAILNIVTTGPDNMVVADPSPTILENKYVYDQVLVSNPLDPTKPLMVWAEADQLPNKDPEAVTELQFAPLIVKGDDFPELGAQRSLNAMMKINAQRVGAQFGTRSVGVFAYGKDEIRFFAIVDNAPVCAIPGKMR